MNLAALIIIIIAVVLAITGGIWQAANWLIWVAIVLAVLALIMFLLRLITGRSKVYICPAARVSGARVGLPPRMPRSSFVGGPRHAFFAYN